MVVYEFLKKIPLFAEMPEEDLRLLCTTVDNIDLLAGENLFSEGDQASKAYIVKSGEVEIVKMANDREVLLAVRGEGVVIGEMALLESMPRTATVRARTDAELYAIQKEDFDKLLESSPTALNALFHTILGRLRENQMQLQQSEKMAQLGTLTAGVAHELNNPAAAVQRSAGQMKDAIERLNSAYAQITRLGFDEKQLSQLDEMSLHIQQRAVKPPELDALTRSDRETEIEDWLDDQGIDDAWEIAPTLVNLDFGEDRLHILANDFPEDRLRCVIEWLNATYEAYSLLNEVGQGARRISSIVKALKSYSYLDQAPVQNLCVNDGLDDTLLILQNKFKDQISVKREYQEGLVEIVAYGSELNQVWTNILDNAIDALAGQEDAQITIRTRQEGEWVVVEIIDNGPGIPEEVLPKIFDSFYTTKEVGKGTGMGLNISYNIVVQQHRGDIKVHSKPGETCFEVWLPISWS